MGESQKRNMSLIHCKLVALSAVLLLALAGASPSNAPDAVVPESVQETAASALVETVQGNGQRLSSRHETGTIQLVSSTSGFWNRRRRKSTTSYAPTTAPTNPCPANTEFGTDASGAITCTLTQAGASDV